MKKKKKIIFQKKKDLSYNNFNLKDNNKIYPKIITKIKLKKGINWKNYFSNKSFSNKNLMNIMNKLRIFS